LQKSVSKLDLQIAEYESRLSSELAKHIATNEQGQLTLDDLEKALKLIRSSPLGKDLNPESPVDPAAEGRIKQIVKRLDVDDDGLVNLQEIVQFAKELEAEEGIGVNVTDESADHAKTKKAEGAASVKKDGEVEAKRKLKKEDIVAEE
jgi:LETM1 and EF-hand domain-containing protein 1